MQVDVSESVSAEPTKDHMEPAPLMSIEFKENDPTDAGDAMDVDTMDTRQSIINDDEQSHGSKGADIPLSSMPQIKDGVAALPFGNRHTLPQIENHCSSMEGQGYNQPDSEQGPLFLSAPILKVVQRPSSNQHNPPSHLETSSQNPGFRPPYFDTDKRIFSAGNLRSNGRRRRKSPRKDVIELDCKRNDAPSAMYQIEEDSEIPATDRLDFDNDFDPIYHDILASEGLKSAAKFTQDINAGRRKSNTPVLGGDLQVPTGAVLHRPKYTRDVDSSASGPLPPPHLLLIPSKKSRAVQPRRRKNAIRHGSTAFGCVQESMEETPYAPTTQGTINPRSYRHATHYWKFEQIIDNATGHVLVEGPEHFGITQVLNPNGRVLAGVSRRRTRTSLSEERTALAAMSGQINDVIEVHIDDDLLGAAAIGAPVEKWKRLMNSNEGVGDDENDNQNGSDGEKTLCADDDHTTERGTENDASTLGITEARLSSPDPLAG